MAETSHFSTKFQTKSGFGRRKKDRGQGEGGGDEGTRGRRGKEDEEEEEEDGRRRKKTRRRRKTRRKKKKTRRRRRKKGEEEEDEERLNGDEGRSKKVVKMQNVRTAKVDRTNIPAWVPDSDIALYLRSIKKSHPLLERKLWRRK